VKIALALTIHRRAPSDVPFVPTPR
jgi:hypothetical protein